ncbi:MAG: hypothetical protein HKL84_04700 [Acidimicrobiaceae bacterium]|nr:hypothetical protein [Acidimicrobiaceae bacterium]
MRNKLISRKVVGVVLSTTVLTGTALAAASGSLPMQLQDSIHGLGTFGISNSSNGSVTLPNPTVENGMDMGAVFGLCTAFLNHESDATTTTTAPTTTTTAATTTTTAATTTTTAVTVSPTDTDNSNPNIPAAILVALAASHNDSVAQYCATVNPKHAALKLDQSGNVKVEAKNLKVDNDDTTTTSSTTTTVPPTTTTGASTAIRVGIADGLSGSSNSTSSGSNKQRYSGVRSFVKSGSSSGVDFGSRTSRSSSN